VGEAPRVDTEHASGPEQERYDNRAYPAVHISAARREQARDAFDQLARRQHGKRHGWEELGPFTPNVPGPLNYTGRSTTTAGRVTALAIGPECDRHDCVLLVAAAGGGVWRTDNALDARTDWEPSNTGIPSNAIGSLIFDPTDATRRTLYAGTGEPNGSSDSEAGVGLYRSTNGGRSWSLVPGSLAVSNDRSIAAIAVDPRDARHLFIGTAVARHGSSSVNGGPQAYLELHCNEFFGDFKAICGDWEPLGGAAGDLTAGPASDKGTGYVVAIERAPNDSHTMWTATRRGRVFISRNADAAVAGVTFTRIDTPAQPRRFVSGISIDDTNPYHALISFSGYNAYTPTTPGHVFDVLFNPATGKAVWKDLSFDLGDQPITSVAYDPENGDVFASTDYGVLMLRKDGTSWSPAASGLPPVAVYGLTIDTDARLLYAATHGRGIWRLTLVDSDDVKTDNR
jgi:hypothetical protein